jgi:hypothetical protein
MSDRTDEPIFLPVPFPEGPAKNDIPERRVGVRYPFTAAAEVSELRSKARVTGRCSDLGNGGCYVDTLSPFPVGAAVRVRVERDHREFEAEAVVAYAHVQMGMGLAFTEIRREQQGVLRGWIAELSGEQPAEAAVSPAQTESEDLEPNTNLRLVLNELITLLVRRKVITENEGTGLLRQMFR